jgi:serine/threonine protein kinase
MTVETVTGRLNIWQLLERLGEGDAGEVYLVRPVAGGDTAILKRPQRAAFGADVARQASQITMEGKILRTLKDITVETEGMYAKAPALLDDAEPGTEDTGGYFVIIEQAKGFDLSFLTRILRFNEVKGDLFAGLEPNERFFLQRVLNRGKVPQAILLNTLLGLILFLQKIHKTSFSIEEHEFAGIIWNDVKPEHIFWDPQKACCTLVDWGNAQFLNINGNTADRRHSRSDDYQQILDEMGKFIMVVDPELFTQLAWTDAFIPTEAHEDEVLRIQKKAEELVRENTEQRKNLRKAELNVVKTRQPLVHQLQTLTDLYRQIMDCGELPDFASTAVFCRRLGENLIAQGQFHNFKAVCDWIERLPSTGSKKWNLLGILAKIGSQIPRKKESFARVLDAGLMENWVEAFWQLASTLAGESRPQEWEKVSDLVRELALGYNYSENTPYQAVKRFTAALDAKANNVGTLPLELEMELFRRADTMLSPVLQKKKLNEWIERIKTSILINWINPDPDLPYSSLTYADVHALAAEIRSYYPNSANALLNTIDQPDAQIKIVLDAWGRREFHYAARALRRVLLWDPDRLRVIRAAELIMSASDWLEQVRKGPDPSEELTDYAIRVEVDSRELRNRIGEADWLNMILDALKKIRLGAQPVNLLEEDPQIVKEFPWMEEKKEKDQGRPSEKIRERLQNSLYAGQDDLSLERKPQNQAVIDFVDGIREGAIGHGLDMVFTEALDTWRPEAQGSSARVFLGFLRTTDDRLRQAAVKIMRPDQIDYATPLFQEEARILSRLQEIDGVTNLYECGFLKLMHVGENSFTSQEYFQGIQQTWGRVMRFDINQVERYSAEMKNYISDGWIPYLALEKRNHETNLLTLCDAGYTQGRLVPVKLGLLFGMQILDILHAAHKEGIVYRDHKILHYYWQSVYNGVFVVDWNVAKWYPYSLTSLEKQFDLVQFGARALHHILTGRTAVGALPVGPTRSEEIDKASHQYTTHWTYDDQRLPDNLKTIIEDLLSGKYDNALELKEDLFRSFVEFSA